MSTALRAPATIAHCSMLSVCVSATSHRCLRGHPSLALCQKKKKGKKLRQSLSEGLTFEFIIQTTGEGKEKKIKYRYVG